MELSIGFKWQGKWQGACIDKNGIDKTVVNSGYMRTRWTPRIARVSANVQADLLNMERQLVNNKVGCDEASRGKFI